MASVGLRPLRRVEAYAREPIECGSGMNPARSLPSDQAPLAWPWNTLAHPMSKLRITTLAPIALAVTLLGGAAVAAGLNSEGPSAQEGEQKGAEHESEEHEHEHGGVLHESMESLQKNMKGLRKLLSKPEMKEDAIAMCIEMEQSALTGFMNPPESPDGLEGAELRAFQADFKKRMLQVTETLVDLELAFDGGDKDEIKKIYRTLGASKKEGHDIYIK